MSMCNSRAQRPYARLRPCTSFYRLNQGKKYTFYFLKKKTPLSWAAFGTTTFLPFLRTRSKSHATPLCTRLRVVPHFNLRDSRASETRARVKITPLEKRRLFSRGVIFTGARVSLALLSLRKNGGLLVVYQSATQPFLESSGEERCVTTLKTAVQQTGSLPVYEHIEFSNWISAMFVLNSPKGYLPVKAF